MWDAKKKLKKECQSNIRSVPYRITSIAGIGITKKFALLSERIGSASGNSRSERRTGL
jgi:hypothetical protein